MFSAFRGALLPEPPPGTLPPDPRRIPLTEILDPLLGALKIIASLVNHLQYESTK